MIEFYLSPDGKVNRPKLMNTLFQSLLWFHEGCREQVDHIAIVKFAASLDALARGKRKSGIMKLIKARLGFDRRDRFRPNGQTMQEGVEEIYGEGRSRTIHGTNENIARDWSSTRRFAESLSRHCLISCLSWASVTNADDPEQMKQ